MTPSEWEMVYRTAEKLASQKAREIHLSQSEREDLTDFLTGTVPKSLATYDPARERTVTSWIIYVMHKKLPEWVTRNYHIQPIPWDPSLDDTLEDTQASEEYEQDREHPRVRPEFLSQVQSALTRITPKQAEAILLKVSVPTPSNRELGQRLGISTGSAQTRLEDGLRNLSRLLDVPRAEMALPGAPNHPERY